MSQTRPVKYAKGCDMGWCLREPYLERQRTTMSSGTACPFVSVYISRVIQQRLGRTTLKDPRATRPREWRLSWLYRRYVLCRGNWAVKWHGLHFRVVLYRELELRWLSFVWNVNLILTNSSSSEGIWSNWNELFTMISLWPRIRF